MFCEGLGLKKNFVLSWRTFVAFLIVKPLDFKRSFMQHIIGVPI